MTGEFQNTSPLPPDGSGRDDIKESSKESIEAKRVFKDVCFRKDTKGMVATVNITRRKRIPSLFKLVPERGAWQPQVDCPYEVRVSKRIDDPTKADYGFKGIWTCIPVDQPRDEAVYKNVLAEQKRQEDIRSEEIAQYERLKERIEEEGRAETARKVAERERKERRKDEFIEAVLESISTHKDLTLLSEKDRERDRLGQQVPYQTDHISWVKMDPLKQDTGDYYFEGKRWARWEGCEGVYECHEHVERELVGEGMLSPDERRYEGEYAPSRNSYVRRIFVEGVDVVELAKLAQSKGAQKEAEWHQKQAQLRREYDAILKKILADSCEAVQPGLFAEIGDHYELTQAVRAAAIPQYDYSEANRKENFKPAWLHWQDKPDAVSVTAEVGKPLPTPDFLAAEPLKYSDDFVGNPVYAYPAITAKRFYRPDLDSYWYSFELAYFPNQDMAEIMSAWGQKCKDEYDQCVTDEQAFQEAMTIHAEISPIIHLGEDTAPLYLDWKEHENLTHELCEMVESGALNKKSMTYEYGANKRTFNPQKALARLKEIQIEIEDRKNAVAKYQEAILPLQQLYEEVSILVQERLNLRRKPHLEYDSQVLWEEIQRSMKFLKIGVDPQEQAASLNSKLVTLREALQYKHSHTTNEITPQDSLSPISEKPSSIAEESDFAKKLKKAIKGEK